MLQKVSTLVADGYCHSHLKDVYMSQHVRCILVYNDLKDVQWLLGGKSGFFFPFLTYFIH